MDYLLAPSAASAASRISTGKSMKFRAESFSAEGADALAAKFSKAARAMATACAGLFPPRRRTADTFALPADERRDIGPRQRRRSHVVRHDPLYEMLELMPRAFFGHRRTRQN
jgi:hypothetical protein